MKKSNYATIYAVVTQGFFTMLVLCGIGFLIGHYLIKSNIWAGVLAVIGALIGLVIFLEMLYKLKLGGDDHK